MMKIILGIVICLFCSCENYSKTSRNIAVAKMTVHKVFLYVGKSKYDSLKLIMPDIIFKNADSSDLVINFSGFKRMIDAGEVFDTTKIKVASMPNQTSPYLVLKLLPVNKELKIDSVKFVFVHQLGYNKIWSYEFFTSTNAMDLIRTQ